MNIKGILVRAMILSYMASFTQLYALPKITSDDQFFRIISEGKQVVIAIGPKTNPLMGHLFTLLSSLQADRIFPLAEFYYTFPENILRSMLHYQLHGILIAAFNKRECVARIPAPVSMNDLVDKLRASFG